MSEFELATVVRRRRHTLAGEGMVTPRQRMTVADDDGRVETLEPGRDRLSIDYPLVARNPDKFVACWDRDVKVRSQLCDYLERSRQHRATRPGRATPATGYGLGSSALQVPTATTNSGLSALHV